MGCYTDVDEIQLLTCCSSKVWRHLMTTSMTSTVNTTWIFPLRSST